MKTVAGIFHTRAEADRALERLRRDGVGEDRLGVVSPAETPAGAAKAMGGVAGAALGMAGGVPLGMAAATVLLPGVGPVVAVGILTGALIGIGGAVGGAAMGEALAQSSGDAVPPDHMFVFEDALRQGHIVALAAARNEREEEAFSAAFRESGAETVEAARNEWWSRVREHEKGDGAFREDERLFRMGFEAARRPQLRGKSFEEAVPQLRECCPEAYQTACFRRGYERGREYEEALRTRDAKGDSR